MRIPARGIHVLWQQWTNSHTLLKSCGEKGRHGHSLSEREGERAGEGRRGPERVQPLPGQVFIAFLGTLHPEWSSFTMHRFTTGDYLLRTTKDRTLLITSKRRVLKLKGEKWLNWLQSILGRFRL